MRSYDAVHISYEDRLDLERAKLAVTAFGLIISVGFDLNQGRKKQWMHDLMRDRVLFVGFAHEQHMSGGVLTGYCSFANPFAYAMTSRA